MPVYKIPVWMYVHAENAEAVEAGMNEYWHGAEYAGDNMTETFLCLIEEGKLEEFEEMTPQHPSWTDWMSDEEEA